MDNRELEEFVEILYSYFEKKIKASDTFKSCIKSTNATVTWIDSSQTTNIGAEVKVRFPYDDSDITVINKSTSELSVGDLVCIHYFIDLKNAYVAYKA